MVSWRLGGAHPSPPSAENKKTHGSHAMGFFWRGGWGLSGQLCDQLDFHAGAQGDLRHATSAAGVHAFFAKDLAQQFAGTVGHHRLPGVNTPGIYHTPV